MPLNTSADIWCCSIVHWSLVRPSSVWVCSAGGSGISMPPLTRSLTTRYPSPSGSSSKYLSQPPSLVCGAVIAVSG